MPKPDHRGRTGARSARAMPNKPGTITGQFIAHRVGNAWRGATDAQGREYSLPQAVASSVGIKLRGQDVRQAMRWKAVDFDREQGRLRLRRSQIVYRRERNLISHAGFEREIGRIDAKLEALKLRRRDALR